MSVTIGCKYSCPLCGLTRIEVAVPIRAADVDVVAWMEGSLIVALSNDHRERSPHCHPDELRDIMVPTDGRDYVGGPITSEASEAIEAEQLLITGNAYRLKDGTPVERLADGTYRVIATGRVLKRVLQ